MHPDRGLGLGLPARPLLLATWLEIRSENTRPEASRALGIIRGKLDQGWMGQ